MRREGAKPTAGSQCAVDQSGMAAENYAKILWEKDVEIGRLHEEIARLQEFLKDEVRPSPEPASTYALLREIRACLKRLEVRLGTDA